MVFSGLRSDYTIELIAPNTYRVTDNRVGPNDGIDVVEGFELFAFSDRTLFNLVTGTWAIGKIRCEDWVSTCAFPRDIVN